METAGKGPALQRFAIKRCLDAGRTNGRLSPALGGDGDAGEGGKPVGASLLLQTAGRSRYSVGAN
ncbi:hypothetical protein EMIT0P44_120103 [Pseudomonas sp. IT-P44]